MEWVPYTLVVGDDELKGKKLVVRNRMKDEQKKYTKKELVKEIKAEIDGMPFRKDLVAGDGLKARVGDTTIR